jgi:glycosyltransferase involved in cell wall biosynthesis
LDSLIAQSFSGWECILVNNGSDDNTKEVCEYYEARDKRFVMVESGNSGPAAARNLGLSLAKGKYIQFLDADDLIESEKLNDQVNYLENNPEADLVYSQVRYFSDDNLAERRLSLWDHKKSWMPEISGQGYSMKKALLKYNIMTIHAPLFRRALTESVGYMDESLFGFEDWDYWLRMALRNKRIEFQPGEKTLALVRSHPGSLNKDKATMRKYLLLVWLKAMKSGLVPIRLWPYVIFRFEEEFFYSLIYAFRIKNNSVIKSMGVPVFLKILSIIVLPLFLPFIFLAYFLRFLKSTIKKEGRVNLL